jgi:hypothetical protein
MGWTKGEIVSETFSEMGIASYTFDIGPEEIVSAIRRLDLMMASWESKGLRFGYPQPSTANGSSSDDDSNIPDIAIEAVLTNLAIRLAPSYGKGLSPDTKTIAKTSLNSLIGIFAKPIEQQKNPMPSGAGYKGTRKWTSEPIDPIGIGDDSILDLGGVFNNDTNK